MTNEEKRKQVVDLFDPDNSVATNTGIFGLPFGFDESEIMLYPVPWEATVSFRSGTASGPIHIYEASSQIDLFDHHFGEVWKKGIYWFDAHISEILRLNNNIRPIAQQYITAIEQGINVAQDILDHLNNTCHELKEMVKNVCTSFLADNRKVGIVGGDHSTPQGYLEALSDKHGEFGILQIDAHADLREAYEGFTYSHASIFHNILAYNEKLNLVQVGVRDYSAGERKRIEESENITTFFDADLQAERFEGKTWQQQCNAIINALPQKVYVSFDIDGLTPDCCPETGTPVPGGLSFVQVGYLLNALKEHKKEIIGFDLSETGAAQWDGIVSSRLLYKLCGLL